MMEIDFDASICPYCRSDVQHIGWAERERYRFSQLPLAEQERLIAKKRRKEHENRIRDKKYKKELEEKEIREVKIAWIVFFVLLFIMCIIAWKVLNVVLDFLDGLI